MGSEDARGAARGAPLGRELVGQLIGCLIAHLAGHALEGLAGRLLGEGRHIRLYHRSRDPLAGSQVAHKLGVFCRIQAPQPMIYMEHMEPLSGDGLRPSTVLQVQRRGGGQKQERAGVRPTGDHEHHRRAQTGIIGGSRPLKGS